MMQKKIKKPIKPIDKIGFIRHNFIVGRSPDDFTLIRYEEAKKCTPRNISKNLFVKISDLEKCASVVFARFRHERKTFFINAARFVRAANPHFIVFNFISPKNFKEI